MDQATKIDQMISSITDWRGEKLAQLRDIINQSGELNEDWKWNTPVWTRNGMICAISAFKDFVKINFFKGALIDDTNNLFNSGLDSKEHRSINFDKDTPIDESKIRDLLAKAIEIDNK